MFIDILSSWFLIFFELLSILSLLLTICVFTAMAGLDFERKINGHNLLHYLSGTEELLSTIDSYLYIGFLFNHGKVLGSILSFLSQLAAHLSETSCVVCLDAFIMKIKLSQRSEMHLSLIQYSSFKMYLGLQLEAFLTNLGKFLHGVHFSADRHFCVYF